eukprot:835216_1
MAEMDPIHDGNNASSFVFNVYGSVQFDHDFVEAPHIIEQASSRPSTDSISPFLIFAAMIRPTMGDIHSNYLDPFSLTDPASFAANPYRIGASKMDLQSSFDLQDLSPYSMENALRIKSLEESRMSRLIVTHIQHKHTVLHPETRPLFMPQIPVETHPFIPLIAHASSPPERASQPSTDSVSKGTTNAPQEMDNLDRNGDGHTANWVQRTHGSDASSFGFNMYGSVQFDHDFMEEFAENNGAPHTTLKRTSFIPIIAQASSPPERTSQPSTCTTFHLDNLDPNDDTNASEFTYHTHPIPLSSGATSTLIEPYPCGGFAHSKQSMSSASDAILFGLKRDDLIAPFSNLSDDTHTKHKKCAAKYVESQVNEDIHTLDMIQSQHPSAFESEEAPPIFGTDYILRYAVMALAVWVSLFSFYRLIRLSSMQLLLSAWLFVAMGRVNALSVCDPVHSMFIINSELIVNDAEECTAPIYKIIDITEVLTWSNGTGVLEHLLLLNVTIPEIHVSNILKYIFDLNPSHLL